MFLLILFANQRNLANQANLVYNIKALTREQRGNKMPRLNPKKKTNYENSLNSVEVSVAKSIAEVIADSVKELPRDEQARRLKIFCDALSDFLRSHTNASSPLRSDQEF